MSSDSKIGDENVRVCNSLKTESLYILYLMCDFIEKKKNHLRVCTLHSSRLHERVNVRRERQLSYGTTFFDVKKSKSHEFSR